MWTFKSALVFPFAKSFESTVRCQLINPLSFRTLNDYVSKTENANLKSVFVKFRISVSEK